MQIKFGLILLLACFIFLAGCGEESKVSEPIIKEGGIQGRVTDGDTGAPLEGASVIIGEHAATTDKDGNYIITGIQFSDELRIAVAAKDYKDYAGTTSLQQELLVINISLVPAKSEKAKVLEVLEGLSADIASLDPNKIPDIQARLSEDYVAGDDEATAFGVFAGVIPPDYEGTPEAIASIIEKSNRLEFAFAEPNVTLDNDMASVEMIFNVHVETKERPEIPANKMEMSIAGKMDFRKEGNDWKLIFWQLIPPFLKFINEPL